MIESEIKHLFKLAGEHVQMHKCSAKPYESGEWLYNLGRKIHPQCILEIGTGIGFTTVILGKAAPKASIETIERDHEHILAAREFIKEHEDINKVKFIEGIAEEILPAMDALYDLIFFDAYGIHYEFLPQYYRLLNPGGTAVIANNHLKSKTSDRFFAELNDQTLWQIIERHEDTTVAIKLFPKFHPAL